MNSSQPIHSWVDAIVEAASVDHVDFPPFIDRGMGSVMCRTADGRRFASFKRPLVSRSEAANRAVRWAFWQEDDDQPRLVVELEEAPQPAPDRVAFILSLLKGWLVNEWPAQTARDFAAA